jgi:predicted ferric reductase
MRQTFVKVLSTPALLATFAKDPTAAAHAHVSLRFLASLEPAIIMPEVLARAYSGLEVVNETHRTTAVLSLLNTVAHPLVSEKNWLGGQKHILELLELSVPGLDLVGFSAMFVCNIHELVLVERSRENRVLNDVYCGCRTAYQDRRPDGATFHLAHF